MLALPRRLPGSLLVVPVVILLFGSEWRVERQVEPPSAIYVGAEEPGGGRRIAAYLVPEATQMEQGIILDRADSLIFEVPGVRGPFVLELQAFYRDAYLVEASPDGVEFEPLWQAPAAGQRGMRTRQRSFPAPEAPITQFRVRPRGGREGHRVAGLRVSYTERVISQRWLIPLLWAAALLLAATTGLKLSDSALSGWRRIDVGLASLLVVAVLFRLTAEVVVIVALAAAVLLLVATICRHLARAPWITIGYLAFLYVLFFVFLPWAVTRIAVARASELYDFTVDHRMRPDGLEINADGIRFLGGSDDLDESDFVILQLGDSFTYGLELDYGDTYPYALEGLLESFDCSAPVKVVNFGWASSSPLLSLRLLRQIGADYKPDLLVYNLDMTDFGDDLRYESELRRAGDLELDYRTVFKELVAALSARFPALEQVPETFARLVRSAEPASAATGAYPRDRFFATARPLEESRADIERGVMKNLAEMHGYAASELRVPMAVVLYPRAYQYSAVESPRNWEENRYQRLGPHVLEPFNYFEEVGDELPYPVFNLLETFRTAEEFPLFFDDDPHWSAAGARLVAQEVAARLIDSELVPCAAE